MCIIVHDTIEWQMKEQISSGIVYRVGCGKRKNYIPAMTICILLVHIFLYQRNLSQVVGIVLQTAHYQLVKALLFFG